MTLVDTSVWIDHFRSGNERLRRLLEGDDVLVHSFVIGELACGSMRDRENVLSHLSSLPRAMTASDEEVMHLIDVHRLWSKGIGWIDAHLLATSRIEGARLFTLDRRLDTVGRAIPPPA